ncbi:MAG: DNA mismatch repair endonuclease MutL [Desulfotomaculaceae bacterium]|nr:DNA mismatch repair endonuclease MutL [Desulfotomaculaceae bacterium]
MARIIVLDKYTADQIAAGEVVERPSSVVKELVENSIDAGARRIVIEIENGGLSMITVSDDGCGIEGEDLELAFQRHATSKITSTGDLSCIYTLGFRGEALPSIAAVSKLTVTTRTHEALTGTQAQIEGGNLVTVVPAGTPPGTTVTVKDLFYNTPARRKTMKSPANEGSLCGELVSRLALARPDIRYEMRVKGKGVFYSAGSGRLVDAATAVYGVNLTREMISLNFTKDGVAIVGLVGKPSISRSTRSHITLVINGRYVRCAPVTAAVEAAYHTLLPQGRKPVVLLSLAIPPELLDVNVHPAKLEVHLLEEGTVAGLVKRALLEALRTKELIPSAANATHRKYQSGLVMPQYDIPVQQERLNELVQVKVKSCVQPGLETRDNSNAAAMPHSYGQQAGSPSEGAVEKLADYDKQVASFPDLHPLAQLPPLYILAAGEDGLYIIDQHAAHERVQYEDYLAVQGTTKSQCLLEPVTLELDYRDASLLTERILWFTEAGFIIEHFGGNTFLLRGVPSRFPPGQEKTLFLDLLDYFKEKGTTSCRAEFFNHLAASVACKNAVKSGEKLTLAAMEALLKSLAGKDNPFTCPHGRPAVIKISYRDLATRFKR